MIRKRDLEERILLLEMDMVWYRQRVGELTDKLYKLEKAKKKEKNA